MFSFKHGRGETSIAHTLEQPKINSAYYDLKKKNKKNFRVEANNRILFHLKSA